MSAPSKRSIYEQRRAQRKRRGRGKARPLPPRTSAPKHGRQEGFALLMSVVTIAILAVLVTDLHETTGTSFAASMSERDRLRAEYLAKSGVNLTRMLIGQERNLRQLVDPIYRALLGRSAPQLPVWEYANIILKPFSEFEAAQEDVASAGYDLAMSEGLGDTHGTFEVMAVAENGKINVNDPMLQDTAQAATHVASQLHALMGGHMSPNKYDPLFSQFDEKGRLTTRLDVIANVIDWWDRDESRTNYDPVLNTSSTSGAEDADYYRSLPQPYAIKNAPFDTIEELRLVRGITDDFWATFVEPSLDDPTQRQITIYGAAKVNPNQAHPAVLLARVCTFPVLREQLLCADPTGLEPIKFITLLETARAMAPVPWFSRPSDFVNFVTGQSEGLYGKLTSFLTAMGRTDMMFTPLVIEDQQVVSQMRRTFTTTARIITIEVTGRSGNAQTRMRTVVNTDPRWVAPPPNAAKMPPLGVFAYFRIE